MLSGVRAGRKVAQTEPTSRTTALDIIIKVIITTTEKEPAKKSKEKPQQTGVSLDAFPFVSRQRLTTTVLL